MNEEILRRKFEGIGARLELDRDPRLEAPALVDVETRGREEVFTISLRPDTTIEVADFRPRRRHLLLLLRDGNRKHKYLCGHDERHWFAAAIPEDARGVATVRSAFEALRPPEVREALDRRRLAPGDRDRRRNVACVRQGEWFFLPRPKLDASGETILRDEPLTRDATSKPHRLEFCFRRGGETVYVTGWGSLRSRFTPASYNEDELRELKRTNPWARRAKWFPAVRNPELYARGRVTHADHATIVLKVWHRVVMNTEHKAEGRRHLQFVD